VWTRSTLNRLLGNQDQAEVRFGLSGAEYSGVMERLPDRSDVSVRSKSGWQGHAATNALGLVPWWAKDIKVGFSSINARAETVGTAPAFRDAWKKGQRCLVITDGFYEWKKPEKQPYAGLSDETTRGPVNEHVSGPGEIHVVDRDRLRKELG
jgi:putative SOS response-associated peptidase YedK